MLKRLFVVGAFMGAFASGALAPACADCCPAGSAAASLTAAQACCGDCAPTLERSSDPASFVAKAALPDPPAAAVLASVPARMVSLDRCRGLVPAVSLVGAPRYSPPRPLRL